MFKALQGLASFFTFHLLRFQDTHCFSLRALSNSFYLPASHYQAFLAAPSYVSLAQTLTLLCFDLFYLYSLPASRLSLLLLEHALLSAVTLGLFYAQTRRDLAAKLSLYQATLRKSVEINQTVISQLNKTNVTQINEEDNQSFERFRQVNHMTGDASGAPDLQ